MNLKIVTEVNTSVNIPVSNSFAEIIYDTRIMLSPDTYGIVPIRLNVWTDRDSYIDKYDKIIPIITRQYQIKSKLEEVIEVEGEIVIIPAEFEDKEERFYVKSYQIELTEQEIVGEDLPNTIFTKAAQYLTDTFGWQVEVVKPIK